jgi:hypothetical protein
MEDTGQFAGFWKRVGAFLIDSIIIYFAQLIAGGLLGVIATDLSVVPAFFGGPVGLFCSV